MNGSERVHPLRILQDRYTRNQIIGLVARRDSLSAPVIDILINKGIFGIPDAYKNFKENWYIGRTRNLGRLEPLITSSMFIGGGIEFMVTALMPSRFAYRFISNHWIQIAQEEYEERRYREFKSINQDSNTNEARNFR
jgi:hypothetical protein